MTIHRSVYAVLALALTSTSCAYLDHQSGARGVSSARPRERMVAERRREGSDVTAPAGLGAGTIIDALLSCDASDSAAVKPRFDRQCTGVDATGNIARSPIDTTTQKRP
jgi:hypothetical protein